MSNIADLPQQVLDGIKRGRYSLLLGAGFSMSSRGPDDAELPSGAELGRRLAAEFLPGESLPEHYGLSQLADAIKDSDLAKYFTSHLRGCRASPGAIAATSFIWRTIYTFNVDDVVTDAYSHPTALQKLISVTFRHRYQRPEDLGEVYSVHLHGSVLFPNDGFVFSTKHYGQLAALDSTWFTVLSDELSTYPFIVVGCSLSESDIEYYLERRQGLKAEATQLLPSIFVTKKLDAVLRARCERFGFIAVEATSESFFQSLSTQVGARPTALELIVPKGHALFSRLPPERAQRLFFRQWLDSSPANLPMMSDTPPPLLRGTEPRWEHIKNNEDILRQSTRNLLDDVVRWTNHQNRQSETRLLVSGSGEGRSCILMRLYYELIQLKIPAFYYWGQERLADEEAVEILTSLKIPVVLIVDKIADCAYPIARLRIALREKAVPYFLIAAEREYRQKFVRAAFLQEPYSTVAVKPLSLEEATALVSKMRSEGLLGRNAHKTNKELARSLTNEELFKGIVSLNRNSPKLKNVVQTEWDEISDPQTRKVYTFICLAHSCGFPVRSSLLSRASSVNASKVTSAIYSELKGMVSALPPMGEYVETRHRRVAEMVVKNLPHTERFDAFVSLATVLASYVNRDAIRRQLPEARLAGRLLDLDDTVRPSLGEATDQFYLKIKPYWEWNSRYWEQRALLELDRDDKLALMYAQHAVGIERHPLPLTTLAKVQFAVANKINDMTVRLQTVIECLDVVDEALRVRRTQAFREIQPLDVGIRGGFEYLQFLRARKTFSLDNRVKAKLGDLMRDAKRVYDSESFRVLKTNYDELIMAFK